MAQSVNNSIPFPPLEMRKLVGPTELAEFDNPSGNFVFDEFSIPEEAYRAVFDFGCGCGRNARKLMQQTIKPQKYVGIDLHKGMSNWCQNNLATRDRNFSFSHYDVYNIGFNPSSQQNFAKFPVADDEFSLVVAISVFTHIVEELVVEFLRECSRIMTPDGYFLASWFLFNKDYFPMMQEFQNSLYINLIDPTNAVIYDYQWLFKIFQEVGLTPVKIFPPIVKGFQWYIILRSAKLGLPADELPEDNADFGIIRASADIKNPQQIGLSPS